MGFFGILAGSVVSVGALWLFARARRTRGEGGPSDPKRDPVQSEAQLEFTRLIEKRGRERRERDAALLAKTPAADPPRALAEGKSHDPIAVGADAVTELVRARGYDTLLDFLRAHPAVSLVGISEEIHGPPAVVLAAVALREALERRAMGFLVRDLIVRRFHEELPKGWRAGTDHARSQVFFLFELRREPYGRLIKRMEVRCASAAVPDDWLPANADDALIVSVYERALEDLDAADRTLVAGGAMLPEPGDAYRKAMGPHLDTVDIYGSAATFLRGYAEVPRAIGHVLAAHWCKSEVDNGGFQQLFWNSTGVLVPEGIEGLDALGLTEAASAMRQAAALLGAPYPRERAARQKALKRANAGDDDVFEPLERAFYAGTKGFAGAADAYVGERGEEKAEG